jgi:hypothetical protein
MIIGFFQEVKNLEKKISTPTPLFKNPKWKCGDLFFWVKNMAKFPQKNREFVKEHSIFGFIFCFSFLY